METDLPDLLSLIPPAWLATIEAYAPHVLAWLLVATALVHLLVPVARAVERWALTSAVTWDDGPARKAVEILEWLAAATAAILAWLPRVAIGGLAGRDFKPGNVLPRERRTELRRGPTARPPSDGVLALALVVLAASLSVATSGCGASALGAQADLVAVGGIATAQADDVLVNARARDLDAIVDAARVECAPDGCDEGRSAQYRAELAATEERWAPVLACRAPVVEALRAWADGIETAHRAATDQIALDLLLALGARFVSAYGALASCVETAAPGVDLPALPSVLAGLGGAR